MDGVLILQFLTVDPVKELQLTISKEKVDFICPSFDPHANLMFSDARFIQNNLGIFDVGKPVLRGLYIKKQTKSTNR